MKLLLVRHTRTDTPAGICYGRSDVPLPAACTSDLQRVAERLEAQAPHSFAGIYASPAKRCKQLAQFLFPAESVHFDSRLLELNFGDWEMRPWDAVPRRELDAWAGAVLDFAPPAGESYRELYRRCTTFARAHLLPLIDSSAPSQAAVVIAHGGVLRGLLAFFLHHELNQVHAEPADPDRQLKALLAEPIGFGAVCCLEVDADTDHADTYQVRYTISPGDP